MNELLNYQADQIERILAAQNLDVRVVGGTVGPRLTVFRAAKPASVKLSAVMRMGEEIALGLGVSACRIARNGHHLTIEIPRRDSETVGLTRLVDRVPRRPACALADRSGAAVVGVDEEGTPLLLPLDSPNIGHVLICGTTGSGKTALARAMIAGLAMTSAVRELGLILLDPKRRGYAPFAGLPHLVHPVICDPEEALGVLAWSVAEMERRDRERRSTPRLVVFIDELADLMQTAGQSAVPACLRAPHRQAQAGEEVEASLTRLAQRGREAGVHVVACTQKPTASVIGSLVKANFPCRIIGKVTDTNDAYVAAGISGTGAERLLGKGDFLVVAGGDVIRMQGAYIGESEIEELVTRLRGGRKMENGRGNEEKGKSGKASKGIGEPFDKLRTTQGEKGNWGVEGGRGKIVDFVERYRQRSDGDAGDDGRGGHNKKDPTEEMITFAMVTMLEDGEVTPYAVQKFHQDRTGSLCSRGRAERAIAVAARRNDGRNRAQTANSKNGKGETGTDA